MDNEIKKIELDISDDRYFQAVALLVDNPRFLLIISKLRTHFVHGRPFHLLNKDEQSKINIAMISGRITAEFKYPKIFNFIIYSAIAIGGVSDAGIDSIKEIDWVKEYKMAKKYKGTMLADYFHQKPYEFIKITNIRQERNLYWKYIPRKHGYKRIANETGINYETVKSAIKTYRDRVNY